MFKLFSCGKNENPLLKLLLCLIVHFLFLFSKGFCLPKEFMGDSAGEGATEFHDYEGGGIGEGEGMKDVSDQIENEEQVRFHMGIQLTEDHSLSFQYVSYT